LVIIIFVYVGARGVGVWTKPVERNAETAKVDRRVRTKG